MSKCANYGESHQATAFKCLARLKNQAQVKNKKPQSKDIELTSFTTSEKKRESGSSVMELNTLHTLFKDRKLESLILSQLEYNETENISSKTAEIYINKS